MSVKTLHPYQLSKFNSSQQKRGPKSPKSGEENTCQAYGDSGRKPGLPIPKGETPYALAKSAEYRFRDLDRAEYYYHRAIKQGDRTESAVKDLASLLHQRGKTKEACEILEKYRHLFSQDYEKYTNLYNTLRKQIDSAGNCQNKSLKISNLPAGESPKSIRDFFSNPVRIQSIALEDEEIDGKVVYYAIMTFNSHSSARKTLEGFNHWDKFKVEWVSPIGDVVGDAHYARHKMEEYRKHHPTFDYIIFERDPRGYVYSMPLDTSEYFFKQHTDDNERNAEKLLGAELYSMIFKEDIFKDY